ncbi:uncharacterized protein LOC130752441 [Actinidia eriantha]|uniref:uncharacterized protein LOC130752441 n=1 Tax=Actinidia eriantha TaxID=165200 RepID=UPI00258F376C|nr:uncharacterized protein LOC130752441 [Actinidia eriantha]
MASNKKEEPSTAPKADRWYNLTLGSSFKDHHPSSKFCTLRYEFKPASIDKNQPGSLHKNKENRVTVDFQNNQPGKSKVSFEGSSEDYKDNDAVFFFDGESFRLERLHRAVKRLRHVRLPGESAAAPAPAPAGTSLGPATESGSPPISKVAKFQPLNKITPHSMPVEIERIEIGDFKSLDAKPKNEKVADYSSSQPNPSTASPDLKNDDLEELLDIVNDDDEVGADNRGNFAEKEFHVGIDINVPHQNDTDDEFADVEVNDDEDKGQNAAEALRAQTNVEVRREQTSSSSGSSGSESSGSRSGSGSGSGSGSSSSDSESSDGDSVNSI